MKIKHVLVVDDSKSARFMLRKMLVETDLAADMVGSGEEALEYLKSNQPDAIFMDHMMPGMDGVATLEKIKSKPEYASIPVVMYTSKEGDEYANEVKSKGAFSILPKPASPDNLATVLKQLKTIPEIPAAV